MDLLVRLYDLPPEAPARGRLKDAGINVRRIEPYEASVLARFVAANFGEQWADEVGCCFAFRPPTCFVATRAGRIVGFAAYECTRRGFFGPCGVEKASCGKGIGGALLLACLHAMRELGYAYAVIGGADGAEGFYGRYVEFTPIPKSTPGIYLDWLARDGQGAREE